MTGGTSATVWDIAATPVLALVLVALVRADLAERRLPDRLTLPLIAAGLGLAALRVGGVPAAAAIGAVVGYAAAAALGAVYFRRRGVEGLGLGDAGLLAAAGAWLGPAALPGLAVVAALGALSAALLTGTRGSIAFGPGLAAAFALFWGLRLLA